MKRIKNPKLKTALAFIQTRAIAQWGEDRWMGNLVKEAVQIIQADGDETATVDSRRSQIYRIFKEYTCNGETLFVLTEAVGCKIQMACTEVKTIEL